MIFIPLMIFLAVIFFDVSLAHSQEDEFDINPAVDSFLESEQYRQIPVKWFGTVTPYWTIFRLSFFMGGVLIFALLSTAYWRFRSISKLNKALVKSEQRFNLFNKYSPNKIHIKGVDGKFLLVNPGFANVFGLDPSDIIGKTSAELTSDKEAVPFMDHDQRVLDTGKPIEEEEIFTIEGKVHTYLTTKFPLQDEDGNIFAIGSTGVDITERIRTEKALQEALNDAEEANLAKSRFLETMSHEFRTPLNAILGFSEILRMHYFGPLGAENYDIYANDIHDSGEHMLELVNDILDIAAIEAGKRVPFYEEFDLALMLKDALQSFERKAKKENISLTLDISENLPKMSADSRSIKQIFLNIMSNAIKFTMKNGRINISVNCDGHNFVINIKDTGIGVSAEQISKITDPFSQTSNDPHVFQMGTGLGLAIVKSLVEVHDGELNIDSEQHVGTSVTVALPCF